MDYGTDVDNEEEEKKMRKNKIWLHNSKPPELFVNEGKFDIDL